MRILFPFYGAKWRAAKRYPAPTHGTIVEPFAGGGGYSLARSEGRDVILVDKDPVIAGLWAWLIQASRDDVLSLPDLEPGQSTDDLDVPQEARWLIGFWLNKGVSRPRKRPSSWMRQGVRPNSFWGPVVRQQVADQLHGIRHWQVICGDYSEAPDIVATWLIDPPYQRMGRHYHHGARDIDFGALGRWSRSRRGQAIVCENHGSDWLPFQHLADIKANSSRGKASMSREAVWTNEIPASEGGSALTLNHDHDNDNRS